MAKPLRVIIADDSLFMRESVKRLLQANGFDVVALARDGQEAVDLVRQHKPDVVTMDFNMPKLNGTQAVRAIMMHHPTPVVMFSAHTKDGASETFEALSAGAVDFCTKPHGEVSADISSIEPELLEKLRAAATSVPRPIEAVRAHAQPRSATLTLPPAGPRIVVIGISTGGPAVLSRVIPSLPSTPRVACIIVQHMPPQFTGALAERLNSLSAVDVVEARDGDRLFAGSVLIAPGGKHLYINDDGSVRIADGPAVHGVRPAADITMCEVARVYRRRAVGLIMTGMGRDGVEGMRAIKAAGGATFAQDKNSCVIYGMPKACVEAGVVDEIVAIEDIPNKFRWM